MKIIIANNNTEIMLKTADSILKKHGNDGHIPEHIKGQTVLSILKKITQRDRTFYVCEVRELAKMNEVHFSAEHNEFFQSLHCMKFEDMHEDTREYVVALLVNYFRGNIVMAYSNQTV